VTGGPVAGTDVGHPPYRDGILGHQFDRRRESFAPCYSKSLPLEDLKKTILYSEFKITYKKSAKQENSSLFMNSCSRIPSQDRNSDRSDRKGQSRQEYGQEPV
jgi:hypothetical protein